MENELTVVNAGRNMLSNSPPILIRGLGTVAVLGGIGYLVPQVTSVLMGGMTALGIGIVAVLAAAGAKFIPAFLQNAENCALETRKRVARWRPVEQLQNNYIGGCLARDKKKEELIAFNASIGNIKTGLKRNREDFPDQDWSESEDQIVAWESEYSVEEQNLAQLESDLETSAKTIKFWERKLQTAEEMEAIKKPGDTREEITLDILNDAAITEITNRLNRSMAIVSVSKGLRERKALIQTNSAKRITDGAE